MKDVFIRLVIHSLLRKIFGQKVTLYFGKGGHLIAKDKKENIKKNVWNYKNNNNNNIEMKEGNAIDEERKSTYK